MASYPQLVLPKQLPKKSIPYLADMKRYSAMSVDLEVNGE